MSFWQTALITLASGAARLFLVFFREIWGNDQNFLGKICRGRSISLMREIKILLLGFKTL